MCFIKRVGPAGLFPPAAAALGWDSEPARQAGPALPASLPIFQLILPSSPLRRCCSCPFHCHFTVRLLFTAELWRGLAGNISIGMPGDLLWWGTPAPAASEDGLGVLSLSPTLVPLQERGGCWALRVRHHCDAQGRALVFSSLISIFVSCNFLSKSLWKQVLFVIKPLFFTLLCCSRGRRGQRPIKGR